MIIEGAVTDRIGTSGEARIQCLGFDETEGRRYDPPLSFVVIS